MSLPTFFSLSGLNPHSYTYDAAFPNAPYIFASLYSFGGFTLPYPPDPLSSLENQCSSDAIDLGHDAVPLGSPLYPPGSSPFRHCTLFLFFAGSNVTAQNQYLLLFQLRGLFGTPYAEYYVGSSLVRTEALTVGLDEQHAIVLDCFGLVYIYVRLASDNRYSKMRFYGVDCYLL